MTDKQKRDLAAEIGDEALDREAGEPREAFISGKCAGDAELAQYVRKYLTNYNLFRTTQYQSLEDPTLQKKRSVRQLAVKLNQVTVDGRYQLVQLLGVGGMGRVFKATDNQTGRPVAIKFARSQHALGERGRMRLVREARTAARLQHPNILAIHDIGQVKDTLYIAMEYVHGSPLTHWVMFQQQVDLKSKLAIMAQVCDALAYADAHGVIHRDIKPPNIIIQKGLAVKVVDFGLAEEASIPNALVQGGGTAFYMSPEQHQRKPLDIRSDIWSTGVTLYQFLTGQLPFKSVKDILSAPTPTLPPQYPFSTELNAILARTLAKDRETRFLKADELAAELRKVQAKCQGKSLLDVAQPDQSFLPELYILPELNFSISPKGELTVREVTRNRWNLYRRKLREWIGPPVFFGALFVLYMAFVVLAPGTSVLRFESAHPFMEARLVGLVMILGVVLAALLLSWFFMACCALEAVDGVPRCRNCLLPMLRTARFTRLCQSREEVRFGYRDSMAALKHGLWQDAAKLLAVHAAKHASDQSRFVTPARYHLNFFECGLCGHHAARLTSDEVIEGHWEHRPDFREVRWGDAAGSAWRSRLTAAPRAYFRLGPEILASFRLNRALVAGIFAGVSLLAAIPLIALGLRWYGAERKVLSARDTLPHELFLRAEAGYATRPDEALAALAKALQLTLARDGGNLKDPETTRYASWITLTLASRSWMNPTHPADSSSHSNTFNSIAMDAFKKSLPRVWPANTGQPVVTRLEHEGEIYSAVFSSDGNRVVTASADRSARIWDAATGRPIGMPLRHDGAVTSAAFSPDGRLVLTTSADHTARIWDAMTGKPTSAPLRHDAPVTSAAFSPNGRRIITASGHSTRVWDTDSGTQIGPALNHDRAVTVTPATFSPDGSRIVTASRASGPGIVWDTDTGNPAGPQLFPSPLIRAAVFSPDGRRIATAASDQTARIWDANLGGRSKVLLRQGSFVESVVFSPDGRRVITKTSNHSLRIWDSVTGSAVGWVLQHSGSVSSALLSPEGSLIVTGSNQAAAVCDIGNGQVIGSIMLHDAFINSAAFSPDGRRIVTAAGKVARVWNAAVGLHSSEEADQLAELAEIAGGYEIDSTGALHAIPPDIRIDRLNRLRESGKFSSLKIFQK